MSIDGQAKVITFIHTRDRPKATAFYRDVLGFKQISDDQFAAVLDLNGIALRVVHIENHVAQPHTVLGWQVADIVATINALAAKGVKMIIYPGFGMDDRGIWTAPDGQTKVCFFNDPDGNNLSLTQS